MQISTFDGRSFFATQVVDEQCPRCEKQFKEGCALEPWLDADGQRVAVHKGCSQPTEVEETECSDREAS